MIDLVGATEDPEEAVGVDAREVGGADPRAAVAELRGLHLEQPLRVGAEHARRLSGSTTRSSQPGCARPTLPRFAAQNCWWSARFQPATPPPNSVAAYEPSTGMPYFAMNASASSGESGAVPETTERTLLRSRGIDVGLEHHAQRGGHEARRRRPVAANGVDPAVHREALEQRERAAVVHALEDAEQAAEVDERRVDDRDAGAQPQLGVAIGLVVLRADERRARASRSERSTRFGGPVVPLVSICTATPGRVGRLGRLRGCARRRRPRRRRARESVRRRDLGADERARDRPARRRRREARATRSRGGRARRRAAGRSRRRTRRRAARRAGSATCAGRLRSSTPIRVPATGSCAATDSTVAPSSPHVRQRPANSIAGADGIEREHRGDALAELGATRRSSADPRRPRRRRRSRSPRPCRSGCRRRV